MRPQGLVNLEALSASRPRAAVEPGPAAAPNPRLVRAAHEFEAQMMKELLEPMRGEDALTADDEDAGLGQGSGSGGALGEFASEALGRRSVNAEASASPIRSSGS